MKTLLTGRFEGLYLVLDSWDEPERDFPLYKILITNGFNKGFNFFKVGKQEPLSYEQVDSFVFNYTFDVDNEPIFRCEKDGVHCELHLFTTGSWGIGVELTPILPYKTYHDDSGQECIELEAYINLLLELFDSFVIYSMESQEFNASN